MVFKSSLWVLIKNKDGGSWNLGVDQDGLKAVTEVSMSSSQDWLTEDQYMCVQGRQPGHDAVQIPSSGN